MAPNLPASRHSRQPLALKLPFCALLCLIGACQQATAPDNPAPARAAAVPVRGVFRDVLKDGGQGPQMVILPAGRFLMGSGANEAGRYRDEGPQRTVSIRAPIAMSKYEVTFADYDRFAHAAGRRLPGDWGWGRGNRPVINVNWNEAKAYTSWLSAQTGKDYRLPTEAEWEYAARAGTSTRYAWGDNITCDQARYGRRRAVGDIRRGECSDSLDGTAPVGRFAANAFGLHDMHGNVAEWVEDCWHDSYQGAPADSRAWITDCVSPQVVARGGSWDFSPRTLRCAYRHRFIPANSFIALGFRVVQDLSP